MQRIEIALLPASGILGGPVKVEALDLPTALTIADINVEAGSAELWCDGKCIGTLTKHGGHHATFWELSRT